jgi:hypothetical protein
MRNLERAGFVLGATALFATTTAGVVAAAPAGSGPAVRHSAGPIAGHLKGNTRVVGIAALRTVCRSVVLANLSTGVPGGIRRVDVLLTQVQHTFKASVACAGDPSPCRW